MVCPMGTEAHAKIISLNDYLCNCNCNLTTKIFGKQCFMYVMFLWMTVMFLLLLMIMITMILLDTVPSPLLLLVVLSSVSR